MKIILGKKVGMTQIFDEKGKAIPVTLVEAGPCFVTQIKSDSKDGYDAVQVGFSESKKLNKPQKGHLKKSKVSVKNLKELRIATTKEQKEAKDAKEQVEVEGYPTEGFNFKNAKLGDEIKVDIFKEGETIDVLGVSKGRGFQGVIKRWRFHRGPMSHGSDHHREPGSIGSAFPQRVVKGTKLPGRMGPKKVTAQNLKIVKIELDKNLIAIEGSVPGANNGLLVIKSKS